MNSTFYHTILPHMYTASHAHTPGPTNSCTFSSTPSTPPFPPTTATRGRSRNFKGGEGGVQRNFLQKEGGGGVQPREQFVLQTKSSQKKGGGGGGGGWTPWRSAPGNTFSSFPPLSKKSTHFPAPSMFLTLSNSNLLRSLLETLHSPLKMT